MQQTPTTTTSTRQALVRVSYRPEGWHWTHDHTPTEAGPFKTLDACFRSAIPEGEEKLVKLPGGCIRRISMIRGRVRIAMA